MNEATIDEIVRDIVKSTVEDYMDDEKSVEVLVDEYLDSNLPRAVEHELDATLDDHRVIAEIRNDSEQMREDLDKLIGSVDGILNPPKWWDRWFARVTSTRSRIRKIFRLPRFRIVRVK